MTFGVILVIFAIGLYAAPSAFAESYTIQNAQGSSTPGCEPNCFIPRFLTVEMQNDVVIFENNDSAAHTTTSGTPSSGGNGIWDSSLMMSGTSFVLPNLPVGDYPYFCMVHPWMTGQINVVSGASSTPPPPPELDLQIARSSYQIGDTISVSGTATGKSSNTPVSIAILSPNDNVVWVDQAYPNSNGSFNFSITTSGPMWKQTGNYYVEVNYGSSLKETERFYFTGPPEPEYNPPPSSSYTPSSGNVIRNAVGSSTPGCGSACFIPDVMRVNVGDVVTWDNPDSAAHTTTSGTPDGGPDGAWDSSLVMSGQSFSIEFTYSGIFPYFCMVHPWMMGTVIVQESGGTYTEPAPEPDTLSVKVARSSYEHGDRLSGSGLASNHFTPVVVTIFSPNGNIVSIDQFDPRNGKFSFKLDASGPMWKQTGTYTVTAQQGGSLKASDDFYLTGPPEPQYTPPTTATPPTSPTPVPTDSGTTTTDSSFSTSHTPHLKNTTWYYYVDSYPSWFPDAKSVVKNGLDFWKDSIPGIKFIQVNSERDFFSKSTDEKLYIEFVKEFGREHVGHAVDGWFIEVGMGDSACNGTWTPFSVHHASLIAAHEIGHTLGLDHITNDKKNIMYPVALNKEYGIITQTETTTKDYAHFIPICTTKDVTTFDWHVGSDDPTYGFDVYFVPSVNEHSLAANGQSFEYYSDSGCSKTNMLSVGGTCSNVGNDSGLLILTGSKTSEPLIELTISLRESGGNKVITSIPNQYSALSSVSEIVSTAPSSTDVIPIPVDPVPSIPETNPVPDSNSSKYGTVNTEKEYVNILESSNIKISGQIEMNIEKGDKVVLTFTNPDGTTEGQTVFPTSDGYFETFLTFDDETPFGNHEIMVTSKGKVIGFVNIQVADTPQPQIPAYSPPTTPTTPTPASTPPPVSSDENICGEGTILKDDVCVAACGDGTVFKDGKCEIIQQAPTPTPSSDGGGCLIATAAFGSEMAPQVQFLREIRDNTVMTTQSGTAFMTGFNQFYYSFSPYVADYERENPVFKEAVKITLTPLLTSLTLLNYVDVDTEEEMLGYGIGIILLNIGMYFVAPAILISWLKKRASN